MVGEQQHRRVDADSRPTKNSALVYLPVGLRPPTTTVAIVRENNLFAESLVAVDLRTGQRKWHYQFVHHPLWNYDMSSAAMLADITVNGRAIKALAIPSKAGLLWVLDRTNGQPVFQIEESCSAVGSAG